MVEYTPETGADLATNEENDTAAVVTQEQEGVQQANILCTLEEEKEEDLASEKAAEEVGGHVQSNLTEQVNSVMEHVRDASVSLLESERNQLPVTLTFVGPFEMKQLSLLFEIFRIIDRRLSNNQIWEYRNDPPDKTAIKAAETLPTELLSKGFTKCIWLDLQDFSEKLVQLL